LEGLVQTHSADGAVHKFMLFIQTSFFSIQQQWHIRLTVSEVSVNVLQYMGGVEAQLHQFLTSGLVDTSRELHLAVTLLQAKSQTGI